MARPTALRNIDVSWRDRVERFAEQVPGLLFATSPVSEEAAGPAMLAVCDAHGRDEPPLPGSQAKLLGLEGFALSG